MENDIETDLFLNSSYDTIARHRSKIDMSVFGVNPTSYRPTPTEEDYRIGVIDRYFVRKNTTGSHPVCEVSGQQYSVLEANPFFTTTNIAWKIAGYTESVDTGDYNRVVGVREFNQQEITRGSDIMWQLSTYLKNLLEFYKKM
jgi:hypothetical protein